MSFPGEAAVPRCLGQGLRPIVPPVCTGFLITELLEQQEETVHAWRCRQADERTSAASGSSQGAPGLALGHTQEEVGGVPNTGFFREASREGPL